MVHSSLSDGLELECDLLDLGLGEEQPLGFRDDQNFNVKPYPNQQQMTMTNTKQISHVYIQWVLRAAKTT